MSKKRYRNRHSAAQSSSHHWLWGAFLAMCIGLVGIFIAISQSTPAGTSTQSTPASTSPQNAPHSMQSMGIRTISLVAPGTLDTNKDHAQVSLVQGHLPPGGTIHQFTVLSDENCTPDGQGISHCLNRLSYGSGQITVRHNHRLTEVPCLEPGETVQLAS